MSTLSDSDLDTVYTDFCKTMTLVGVANSQQFLARFALLAMTRIGNREVISDLIEDYEDENIVIGPVSDARMLRFLLDARDVTQSQTALDTGISESTISEILAGKRKLNRSQIGKLARYFHVEPGVFNFGE